MLCYFCPLIFSVLSRLQPIFDIAEICAQQGIVNAILCPGSRCAPLTLTFTSHPKINTKTVSDERSAAFIGLGMAQQTKLPTVLVCTSGSAAYNFAPAVAEAFFQQIPLLIITADRPTEWIDQWDGQTIRQQNIYGNHAKGFFQLPQEYSHPDSVWHIQRVVNEAINLSHTFPAGPVQINVPLREPLYPVAGEKISFTKSIRVITQESSERNLSISLLTSLSKQIQKYAKVVVVAGQQDHHPELIKLVEKFCKAHHAVLVGDVISNFHASELAVRQSDVFLAQCGESIQKSLAPELLITFGKSVISKNLKLFLRKNPAAEHWHIQPSGEVPDPFQTLTKVITTEPKAFFETVLAEKSPDFETQKKENFTRLWQAEEDRTKRSAETFFKDTIFSEFHVLKEIVGSLPTRCNIHLANSMAVRYANMISLSTVQKGIHVFCNRGTSGIDGCTSTAVGHALTSDIPNILITGDMAFFYDRNAFWHNYPLPNLRVVVVNNHGGIIFNMIDGPATLQQSAEYFVTHQKLTAKNLAQEFGHEYILLDSEKKLKNNLKDFFEFDGKTKILEIESNQQIAKEAYTNYKSLIKKGYDT